MNWSDVRRPPSDRLLRQFAGVWIGFFLVAAAARWLRGGPHLPALVLAVMAVVVGVAGLLSPRLIKPIYVGWMIAAFPIGWTVSKVALAAIFYVVLTPISWAFRIGGRDVLRLRRAPRDSYWNAKRQPGGPAEYFRQS
jgi:hypothetical protein